MTNPARLTSGVPPLADDTCQVWWAAPGAAHPGLTGLLDGTESVRYERFLRDVDRARMLVGVALAKTVLAAHLDLPATAVTFVRTCARCGAPHGKPRLSEDAGPLHLSVSHSGDRVAVAVTRRAPVGVDVEGTGSGSEPARMAAAVLTDLEYRRWQALAAERRGIGLAVTWTRKESVLKATGDGLSVPLNLIGVGDPEGTPALEQWPDRPARPLARLYDLSPGPGYAACVTVLDERPCRVEELDGAPLLHAANR